MLTKHVVKQILSDMVDRAESNQGFPLACFCVFVCALPLSVRGTCDLLLTDYARDDGMSLPGLTEDPELQKGT